MEVTPEQFCYWLQGYMELADNEGMTERQVQTIADHLKTVFNKVTPDRKEEPKKKVLSEKKKKKAMTIEEVLQEMGSNRPDVYCSTPGRIC